MAEDIELGASPALDPLKDLVKGYPKLAKRMGDIPEMAMFRRFSVINTQLLLHLQAEITTLERDLRLCELVDSLCTTGKRNKHTLSWSQLQESATSDDEETKKQYTILTKLRNITKEYNEALYLQFLITSMPKPCEFDLKHIRKYIASDDMGPFAITGWDADIWGVDEVEDEPKIEEAKDLVALRARHDEDSFSKLLTGQGVRWLFAWNCHRNKRASRIHGLVAYEDSTFLRVTRWITSILASLLPVMSIIVLHLVKGMLDRLAIIAAFNVTVSVCLIVFTTAKRPEIFAYTAAFAAIQVIFISTS